MKKDWKGNSKAAVITTGGHIYTKEDREENDFYATNPIAIDYLFREEQFSDTIWECSCGQGHLSKRMEELGKVVYSTDLINRGYGIGAIDFLKSGTLFKGDIITNPPYKYAKDFIIKALSLTDGKAAMFLRLQFMESIDRYELFKKFPPENVYVFSKRVGCAMNGDFKKHSGSAVAYAWYIWRKGYEGKTTLNWINPDLNDNGFKFKSRLI